MAVLATFSQRLSAADASVVTALTSVLHTLGNFSKQILHKHLDIIEDLCANKSSSV